PHPRRGARPDSGDPPQPGATRPAGPRPGARIRVWGSILPGWAKVTPFTLLSGGQFRPAGPPLLESEAYARDFNEVKSLGGKSSAVRIPEQTQIARFWYEGSAQGWNRIARGVAAAKNLDQWDHARLLALVNMD